MTEFVSTALQSVSSGVTILLGVTLFLAGVAVLWILVSGFSFEGSVKNVLWNSRPDVLAWYTVLLSPVALYHGVTTILNAASLLSERLITQEPDTLDNLPTEERVSITGNAIADETVLESPISGEAAVAVTWGVETVRDDSQVYQSDWNGVDSVDFIVTDDHDEVMVPADESLTRDEWLFSGTGVVTEEITLTDVTESSIPSKLQSRMDIDTETVSKMRLKESRLVPNGRVGVCGRHIQSNQDGRWTQRIDTERWVSVAGDMATVNQYFSLRVASSLLWGCGLLLAGLTPLHFLL